MSAREVITIQCGHFANFVGTHWWNIQEAGFSYDSRSCELQHDCMFREGLSLSGEQTYTPRLIALDLAGSLRTLKQEGVLYDTSASKDSPAWEGGMELHHADPPQKNKFLTDLDRVDAGEIEEKEMGGQYILESSVEVWSDFERTRLHPRSLLIVPGYFHNDPHGGFDTYPAGLQAWENREFREAVEDRLHFFSEECDSLQGFHLLVDWAGGFGGVAGGVAQDIRDEFPAKGLLSVLLSPLSQPLDQTPAFRPALLDTALTLDGLLPPSSLLSPLSLLFNSWGTTATLRPPLPHLHYQPSLAYHSSALLASALETVTLLYRTEHAPTSLPALCERLTTMGRKVCGVGVRLPLPLPPDSSLAAQLDSSPLHPLTPFCSREDVRWEQAVVLRGVPPTYPLCSPRDPRSMHCSHPSLVLAEHLSEHHPRINSLFSVVQRPMSVSPPYPNMLPPQYHTSLQVPVCASLSPQSGLHRLLASLLTELRDTKVRRLPAYSSCLDPDSYSELLHSLTTLTACYQTNHYPECSSDSD